MGKKEKRILAVVVITNIWRVLALSCAAICTLYMQSFNPLDKPMYSYHPHSIDEETDLRIRKFAQSPAVTKRRGWGQHLSCSPKFSTPVL